MVHQPWAHENPSVFNNPDVVTIQVWCRTWLRWLAENAAKGWTDT
jgi:hypothetical protein